jgi:hypothetical protein
MEALRRQTLGLIVVAGVILLLAVVRCWKLF